MPQSSPFLTFSNTILWLKVVLSVATFVLLCFRARSTTRSGVSAASYPLWIRTTLGLAVLLSFAVFHNFGSFRGGTFVHYGDAYHYYIGAKYFKELGYYELYNATIVADSEQDNALAALPFYTDLKTYQNTPRETALRDLARIRSLFSEERWTGFKDDIAFFKKATGMPHSKGLTLLLMDHGYNASPASTVVLGTLANLVPAPQVQLLAGLDVLLVAAMIALVFRTYGFEMGALFAAYFFFNILSGHEFISGSLLRYDWLFYIVAAVCLLDKKRYAWSALFLTLSAMMRVFPALLFYGVAVAIVRNSKTGAVDKKHVQFVASAGVTALALFLLPAVAYGSAWQPWKDFYSKTQLHDSGVYVNHLGLRGVVLFEPSHLSLDSFVKTYKSAYTNDIVRHWQNIKEHELGKKRPVIVLASFLVLIGLAMIIWKRQEAESGSIILWPLFLVYTASYLSHYYYAFLCLFVLLFFRRSDPLRALVPLGLLLTLNVCALVTDYFRPSPIVFFTSVNIYLFLFLAAILGFELYTSVFGRAPTAAAASFPTSADPKRSVGGRRRRVRPRAK